MSSGERDASAAAIDEAASDGGDTVGPNELVQNGVFWLQVAIDVPLPGPFDYRSEASVAVGQRVIVPFGRRQLVGIVVGLPAAPSVSSAQVRSVERILDDLPPLPEDWLRLTRFAADYYQRPWGEVMLPALPGLLRKVAAYCGPRAGGGPVSKARRRKAPADGEAEHLPAPSLNAAQVRAVSAVKEAKGFQTHLLFGVTGSGKTEVYLQIVANALAQGGQALLLVPEINLTPQLQRVLLGRLQAIAGTAGVAVLHSGLAESERLAVWLRVASGEVRILLGTRLAVLTPIPDLRVLIVDEEHDPSYKQQEGLRYSARDLAIWRARDRNIPIVLGSATPSLESWHHANSGRYQRLDLPERAASGALPTVRLLDTRRATLQQGLAPTLVEAIEKRLSLRQQVLIFLNRRGYAPVLHCAACGWVSQCHRCSAYRVLHRKPGGSELRCHHCGAQTRVPKACPDCGNQDLQPMGRGTQRLEEGLAERFPEARVARIDADSTRRKGSAEALFAQVHAGEIDILVGTQMVAKGHDFRHLGLVGVLNADAMLFSQDFRAPERLFAQLMQVAGRAGRHQLHSEVMIQTGYPEQTLYQALLRHDYAGFAEQGLAERQSAGLPPFAYHALLTAEARELAQAVSFLAAARDLHAALGAEWADVVIYDPVPLRVVRVNRIERAQLLIECASRPMLQGFLPRWLAQMPSLPQVRGVRWQLEVDPQEI